MKKIVLSLFCACILFCGINSVDAKVTVDINGNPICEEGEYCPIISEKPDNDAYEDSDDELGISTYKKVQCGDTQIPKIAATLVHTVYTILQIAVPVLMVIFGSLDLAKATIAQKEDEIKKGQHIFIRRLILGVVVFVIFAAVKLVIGVVAPDNNNPGMWDCVDCLINGDC